MYGAGVLTTMRRRLRALLVAPSRPELARVDARLDNIETALHRDVHDLRDAIEQRSFAIAELVMRPYAAEVQAAARMQVEAAVATTRRHAEEASASAARAAIEAAREHAEAAVAVAMGQTIHAAREHAEAAATASEQRLAQLRVELGRTQRAVERLELTGAERPGIADDSGGIGSPAAPPASDVDNLLYLAIEDRFRGDPAEIRIRQERYLPFLPDLIDEAHPLLDLGAGRGEWLGVLAEHDVPARGVDSNESCVDECCAAGLRADVADLVEVLATSDDHSFGAISMFHVVEHLPFGVLADVIRECARVLVPGGLLIAETPNALNLRVAATNFWLDPTHVRPLHPELLKLLADRAGFARTQDLFLNEIGTPLALTSSGAADEWIQELSRSLDGPGDYALLAWTPHTAPG